MHKKMRNTNGQTIVTRKVHKVERVVHEISCLLRVVVLLSSLVLRILHVACNANGITSLANELAHNSYHFLSRSLLNDKGVRHPKKTLLTLEFKL